MLEQTVLEIIENSERVTINHDNEVIYVDKVPTGLKAAVFFIRHTTTNEKITQSGVH